MALAPHGSSPGITHLYYPAEKALWPFGWGLGYTTFAFTWLNAGASQRELRWGQAPPSYSVNVTNTGSVTSDVSVLGMYSTGLPGEPLEKLFDFERIAALAPGHTVTVHLTLPAGTAATTTALGERVLVPGAYTVRVGEPGNWVEGGVRVLGQLQTLTPREATLGPRDKHV